MSLIAPELEENIQFTFRDARDRGLEHVTIEHLVLCLLDGRDVRPMLRGLAVDRRGLRQDLERFLEQRVPQRNSGGEPRPTPAFARAIRRALDQGKNGGARQVTGIHVLYAIHHEPESFAARYMEKNGLTPRRVASWMDTAQEQQHVLQRRRSALRGPRLEDRAAERRGGGLPHEEGEEEGLESSARLRDLGLTAELTSAARDGKLERPCGRDALLDSVLRVLCRRYKSNPLLLGAPGVGKTAVVHALAHRIAAGDVPPALQDMEILEISIGGLVAGTKYRGDFEQRLKRLVEHVAQHKRALVFLDEFHALAGAGAVAGGALDAASILKPYLASGKMRCIGATTHAEFARHLAKDASLLRRFQRIEVPEPSVAEAETILATFTERLETHHGRAIAPDAVPAAVRLAQRFLPQRRLPDKAIDLLDEAGAAAALAGSDAPIDAAALSRTVARMSGKSAAAIERGSSSSLNRLGSELSRRVFGQADALAALTKAVRRSNLGVGGTAKPIGSFVFAGPTGVGKTETARALADALGYDLVRFDMSEYMEGHSVARLIGAPPGYVGYEQRGLLTERVDRQPHCVLLLDEIEKAHADVFNMLLQVMDYGRLTDTMGIATDFRHAVLIMTTNAGAEAWDKPPLGFAAGAPAGEELSAVERLFAPEFRNRLSDVIRFLPLDAAVTRKILELELRRLAASLLAEHGVRLAVRPALKKRLLRDGFSASFGARPLQRLIESVIVDGVADAHLRGELRPGGDVVADLAADGSARISCSGGTAAKKRRRAKQAAAAAS